MVGQIRKVTGAIVKGAADDQERVISSSLGGFPRTLLPVEYLVVRDHSCSVPKDHARRGTSQAMVKVSSTMAKTVNSFGSVASHDGRKLRTAVPRLTRSAHASLDV